jgi:hypothetical protein
MGFLSIVELIIGLIPFIGKQITNILNLLFIAVIIIIWIIGIVKSLSKVYWKPIIIYDLAKYFER